MAVSAKHMETTLLERHNADPSTAANARAARARVPDDSVMLRTAVEVSRDLAQPSAAIYWNDLIASAITGYAALLAAMLTASTGLAIAAGVVAVLALYRAGSFIHELTHLKESALPGFRLGWNMVIGIPLMVPSFMYEGVHTLHHARTRYGTADDPEYLALALMKPWSLPLFVTAALLAPVALLARFAVLAPLSVVSPSLRTFVTERFSALAINPAFRRRPSEGAFRAYWLRLEVATSIWAVALLAMVATGVIPLRAFLIFLAVASGVAVINQVRTLVAHLWENEGEPMTVTAQYLDSVNVPPPSPLAAIWAPVGLRYHALHHLLPSVPYHALGEAHRRLKAELVAESPYHRASYPGLGGLVGRLASKTVQGTTR